MDRKGDEVNDTSTDALSADIAHLRNELAQIAAELQQRKRELFDWRLQLRRHALGISVVFGGLIAAVTIGVVLKHRRHIT